MGGIVAKYAFLPPPRPNAPMESIPEAVLLETKHTRFPALYIRHPRNRLTALYSHGNAEDITQIAPWLRVLSQELGVNFIAYEYPGYSYSASRDSDEPLTPSEKLVFDHADASYKYATETLNIPPNRIVIFGRSLGSGPATHLASRNTCGGLILQSPLESAIRVVKSTLFTLPFDLFANCDKIHRVKSPVLIIHGTHDEVINVSHGQRLFELSTANDKDYLEIVGAGHNDIEFSYQDQYMAKLRTFFRKIEASLEA